MKKLKPVNIHIDTNMDADTLGSNLVECVSNLSDSSSVVNLIKVHCGEDLRKQDLSRIIQSLVSKPLEEMGAKNCIFVPILKGFIEDITIDYIEVIDDDTRGDKTTCK